MGYYNKMNPLNKNGFYTPVDGCGGTYEDKFYVNGMYIDLCGLSVEEYMKNPCCCNSNNNNNDTGTTKPTNEILVKTFTDENGIIFYQAFAKFPVTSTLRISVSLTPESVINLYINTGDTTSKAEQGEVLNAISITLSVNEDENYRYIAILEVERDTYEVYYNALPLSKIDVFDNSFKQIIINDDDINDIDFVIPATDFNYNELEDIDEIERFFNENQYCFIIYLPEDVYKDNKYVISSYDNTNVSNKFMYYKELTINNIKYVCLVEKATDDVAAFVPQYNEDITFKYKLAINI